MKLMDGANIAVVGGGPSGSFFSYFAQKYAAQLGIKINIDLFEFKDFNCAGPQGCNHCGGIISNSLIQSLSKEGITIPSEIIRKEITSYTLHIEDQDTIIEAPLDEQKIIAIFRGLGPNGCINKSFKGFDQYILSLCENKGINIIKERVTELTRIENGILLKTNKNFTKEYDFIVGAIGLNRNTFKLFHNICPSFEIPKTSRTFIGEIELSPELIEQNFGNSMHVFFLDIANIKFGALIPKDNHITIVLIADNVDDTLINNFLNAKEVKRCFPSDFDIFNKISCRCFPFINVKGAKLSYADRAVLIGDSSTSKLYKNGIGAAYITAKAAANAAIFHGVSTADFKKHHEPVCNNLKSDNKYGRFIFWLTSIIQRSIFLKRLLFKNIIKEQRRKKQKRRMSTILWDIFTGSTAYRNIFFRFFNPKLIFSIVWNAVFVIFAKKSNSESNFRGRFKLKRKKRNPNRSDSVYTDIKYFFINKPPINTLIKFDDEETKRIYCQSIMQRMSIDVDSYKMFNIHQIGVNTPISYLFDELLKWDGNSSCWPNHIAKVHLVNNNLNKIQIHLFDMSKYLFGFKPFHLFDLNAIKIKRVPSYDDPDNARYLLYQCKGGYPIGVFSMYTRTSIPERGEKEMSQLFFMVGFDFFGSSSLSNIRFIRKLWAFFHNRVTSNVAYRFKQLCEYRFNELIAGK